VSSGVSFQKLAALYEIRYKIVIYVTLYDPVKLFVLREEYRMRLFAGRMLKKVCGNLQEA
jgi:hypothetical protein